MERLGLAPAAAVGWMGRAMELAQVISRARQTAARGARCDEDWGALAEGFAAALLVATGIHIAVPPGMSWILFDGYKFVFGKDGLWLMLFCANCRGEVAYAAGSIEQVGAALDGITERCSLCAPRPKMVREIADQEPRRSNVA